MSHFNILYTMDVEHKHISKWYIINLPNGFQSYLKYMYWINTKYLSASDSFENETVLE